MNYQIEEAVELNTNSTHEHPREHPLRARLAALGVAVLVVATASLGVSSVAHADEVRDGQWYLDTFDINKIHELSQGAGVTIGVIDSGIDATHPDFEGNVKAGKDFTGDTDDGLKDNKGHGTAVASVIAGHGHGGNGADGIMGIAPKPPSSPHEWATIQSPQATSSQQCNGWSTRTSTSSRSQWERPQQTQD